MININSKSNEINLGYACINMQLANPKKYNSTNKEKIICNRSMIKKTFSEKGIKYASELGLKNCIDLQKIVKWNNENNFTFFRITSDLFPWSSEYKLKELPDYSKIKKILSEVGTFANNKNIRLTSHPGPFNVLTSIKPSVVQNCIKDLSTQGETFDLMGLSRSPYNKINIHIGGAYNNKKESMERFCRNFNLLPKSVKDRLTVENDDRESLYNVKDLYNGVYKKIGIPIVFDYHHHKFNNGGITEKEALILSTSTWQNITPVVHYSESMSIEQENSKIKPQAHSNFIYNHINTYKQKLDIMIEAKQKELAVLNYLRRYGI